MPEKSAEFAGTVGRRVAAALYWIVAIYVIGAGFVSVIPQIFWPASAGSSASPSASADCAESIRALQDALLEHAADRLRDLPSSSPAPFLEPWDERYRALDATCGDLREYTLLARLRYGVEEHLERFEAELRPLAAPSRPAPDARLPH